MTWHWIMTLTWPTPLGEGRATGTGTIDPTQAAALGTRTAAYRAALALTSRGHVPDGAPVSVVFFSLEPDSLIPDSGQLARPAGGAS